MGSVLKSDIVCLGIPFQNPFGKELEVDDRLGEGLGKCKKSCKGAELPARTSGTTFLAPNNSSSPNFHFFYLLSPFTARPLGTGLLAMMEQQGPELTPHLKQSARDCNMLKEKGNKGGEPYYCPASAWKQFSGYQAETEWNNNSNRAQQSP